MSDLQEAWRRLRPTDPALGADLLSRWSEPHRRYHTLEHLAYMLDVIDRYPELAADADAVRLAAWFHDAVYDPRAPDNEERSAELARQALPGDPDLEEVVRLVLLTKTHHAEPDDRNGALLCDADLAILAAPPERYAGYTKAVREEYAFVPDEAFRIGRRAVLEQLLSLPALFHLVPDRVEWTDRALTNIRTELAGR